MPCSQDAAGLPHDPYQYHWQKLHYNIKELKYSVESYVRRKVYETVTFGGDCRYDVYALDLCAVGRGGSTD
jgi:hypothetical protein